VFGEISSADNDAGDATNRFTTPALILSCFRVGAVSLIAG
jgi:hypothetical protein